MTKFMIDRACCENGSGVDNQPKDCLGKWKQELEHVSNEYNEMLAETNSYHDAYTNSLIWETKLHRWHELVKTTDGKADEVVNVLQFLADRINLLCKNSHCTVEALEKIICLVKRIFDAFYSYDEDQTGLKDKIIAFKKEVECSNASDEDKAEAIKCIENYEAKIMIVCELQTAILDKLLETLKCTILLDHFFCDENSGLKQKIIGIIDDFELGLPEEEQCGTGGQQEEGNDYDPEFPCDPEKVKPKPKFRIGQENTYFNEVAEAYETAKEKTRTLKEKWISHKKNSDNKLSHKTSLTEAIRAAEAAESGK
ncbi:hypothetical protein KUV50_01110 [Membranicola marinus]|uniref:Uncharacterized protein n=1 Tax=Membranihabitans marinus TaxID=1227546 RepID=A0A953LBJ9_9BACT|nr:hypothetical protein [Membranihabitans marinus]MBY5956714.1 hypothetical protein [Membranihabitans marinus]